MLPDSIVPLFPEENWIKKHIQARSYYESNFSDNLYAIRDMIVEIKSSSSSTSGSSRILNLQYNGVNQPITMDVRSIHNREKQLFYIKIPSQVTGIPFQIYSHLEDKPISIGYYTNNPEEKILFASENGSESYSSSWDFYPSKNNPGYVVIESQSLIGQGESGDWMDIYHKVWENRGSMAPVGFGKYANKRNQEFSIRPFNEFRIVKIEFPDDGSAAVVRQADYCITKSYTNTQYSAVDYDMPFVAKVNESSNFIADLGVSFTLTNPTERFKRPSVIQGVIDLTPGDNTSIDLSYNSTSVSKDLSVTLPFRIPARSKLEVTYHFNVYNVKAYYENTIECFFERDRRTTKITGFWNGTIYVDENPVYEHDYKLTNLETGEISILQIANKSTNSARIIL